MSVNVAEEASTDGTINVQCLSDDTNYKKTTSMKMPMDYLEVPEPSLTWGFLELAKEARNVCVEYEQCIYTDEILPQGAVMTRRNDCCRIILVLSAGRCSPVDKMGQDGPGDETERSKTEDRRTDPIGPVGPYVTFDQVQPVAEGPVGPYITLSPVGSDGKYSPCDTDHGSGSETDDRGIDPVGPVRHV